MMQEITVTSKLRFNADFAKRFFKNATTLSVTFKSFTTSEAANHRSINGLLKLQVSIDFLKGEHNRSNEKNSDGGNELMTQEIIPIITETTVVCYKLRNLRNGNFANFTLDIENGKSGGRVSISSSYGDFSYYWSAPGDDLKAFLCSLNIEYAADKFDQDRWFDADATVKGFKQTILESRRFQSIDRKFAKECWDAVKDLAYYDKDEFYTLLGDERDLMRLFDGCPPIEYDISPQFKRFWTEAWLVMMKHFQTEKETVGQKETN
jgi:hypothetical protein